MTDGNVLPIAMDGHFEHAGGDAGETSRGVRSAKMKIIGVAAGEMREIEVSRTIHGVVPVLPTPFTADGAIDDIGFSRVIELAINSGANGLAMFGLASEYYKLSETERSHLVKVLVRQAAGRCPVIISIVSHATTVAVAEALAAVQAGADALMVLPPFFLAPSHDAVMRHIQRIAAAVTVPIIVQYAPLQTGRSIDAGAFAKLFQELPNLSHVKVDMVPSGPMISSLHSSRVKSLVGYMGLHLPQDFLRGVDGVMPTVSLCSAFVELWRLLGKDQERARDLHRDLLPLLNFMMQSIEFLITVEKELLVHRGVLGSACCREPAYPLDAMQKKELEAHAVNLQRWLPLINRN